MPGIRWEASLPATRAGGAIVAHQGRAPNGNESVGWQTADPVTGSRKDHEKEPFGQEIGGPPPETDDDPYAGTAPLASAEEP